MNKAKRQVAVLLPDIRSAHNVGSIFRTCDAAGIDKVYLSGHSPCPIDRFNKARKDIAKTALGAEKSIPWEYQRNAISILKKLKAENFYIVAIEQAKNSVDYKKMSLKGRDKVLFVFGNEVDGLSGNILKHVDIVAELPMKGKKESLNVSVSAGIALFRVLGL